MFNHYFGGYILEKYLRDLSVIEEFENLNLNFAFLTEKVNSQFKFHFLVNHRGTYLHIKGPNPFFCLKDRSKTSGFLEI